jgi:DNA-binding SARP family transcriptional activator
MMHHRAREEWDLAISTGARLLAIDPLLEHVHRSLILCHYRKGNRAGAIAQFEACKRVLMRELGIHPMRETVEAYEIVKSEKSISPIPKTPPAKLARELTDIRDSIEAAHRGLAKLMQDMPPT